MLNFIIKMNIKLLGLMSQYIKLLITKIIHFYILGLLLQGNLIHLRFLIFLEIFSSKFYNFFIDNYIIVW